MMRNFDFTGFDKLFREAMREVLAYRKMLDETKDDYYRLFGRRL